MSTSANDSPSGRRAAGDHPQPRQLVRHEPRRRTVTITQVEKIAAHMIRIALTGDLEGLKASASTSADLFFPDGTTNAEGAPNATGARFPLRQSRSESKMQLEIDFAIHDAGAGNALGRKRAAGTDARPRRPAANIDHPSHIRLAFADR